MAADGVEALYALNLVVPETDAETEIGKGGEDVHRVALDAETAVGELYLVANVLPVQQLHKEVVAGDALAYFDVHSAALELFGVADAVDAAHRTDHDDVAPAAQQGRGGTQAEFVEVVVDCQVFFDISVGGGDVSLWLIVVVVGDEVFDSVVREELLELAVELGGEGLVMAEHQRGTLQLGDDVGHRKGLAAAGNTLQHLRALTAAYAFHQLADGFGLVAHGGKVGF